MSHNVTMDSRDPFVPPLNDWRSERSPPNINFCELPYCCIPVVHRQFWVQFSQVTPVQRINLELYLVGFPKPVPPVALCSHFLNLLDWEAQSSWWMPTHFWTLCTLSISDAVSVHHHQTPALIGSEFQGWKFFAYINRITPQSFPHNTISTIISTTHTLVPQIGLSTGCCTICCMLPLLQSAPHTIK